MNKEVASKIWHHLIGNQEAMLHFLRQIVAIETPSRNKEAQLELFQFLEKEFQSLGYYVLHVPGKETGGYLYARPLTRRKNNPIQLLIGHCDTVWSINTLKEMPISEQDGKIRGPGIYDMKAGLTQIFFSIQTLQKLGLSSEVTPVILINSDEEIGSKESTSTIKRLANIANRAFILEPPLGLDGKLKTARKGIGRFIIKVKGKAAHAGLDPTKGINAIVELSHQVQQLFAMNDFEKGITVNVGMIEGGISANVIAPESKAVVDVRVLNRSDGEYITKKIHQLKPMLADVELFIEGNIGRPPMEKTVRNRKLWNVAKIKGSLLDLKLEEATAGGGSDGNTTSLFTPTLDGLGTTGDGAHAAHEFIYVKKLPERTALLSLLLLADPLKKN
ncbi:MAG: M20 family metallopeptidase [Aureibaculum sp.]|nr:M20 family metallopeptidase [Aureibaculum sp.]